MIKQLVSIASSICVALPAMAEVTHEEKINFRIEYNDGTVESGIIKYQANVTSTCEQSGKSSKPLQGHPIDDRVARFEVRAWIERKVCMVSKVLGEKCDGPWNQIFNQDTSGHGEGFDPIHGKIGHSTCGGVQGEINSAISAKKTYLGQQLPVIMQSDVDKTIKLLKNGQVTRVIRGN